MAMKRLKGIRGITYLELIVAMSILSMAFVTASPLLLRYHHYRKGIFLRYQALYAAEAEFTFLKSLPPGARPTEYAGAFLSDGKEAIRLLPEGRSSTRIERTGIPGLSTAEVTVEWTFFGREYSLSREIRMRTEGRAGR
jgi:hypothetical protein